MKLTTVKKVVSRNDCESKGEFETISLFLKGKLNILEVIAYSNYKDINWNLFSDKIASLKEEEVMKVLELNPYSIQDLPNKVITKKCINYALMRDPNQKDCIDFEEED